MDCDVTNWGDSMRTNHELKNEETERTMKHCNVRRIATFIFLLVILVIANTSFAVNYEQLFDAQDARPAGSGDSWATVYKPVVGTNNQYAGVMFSGTTNTCATFHDKAFITVTNALPVVGNLAYALMGTCTGGTQAGRPCITSGVCSGGGSCTTATGSGDTSWTFGATCILNSGAYSASTFITSAVTDSTPIATMGTNNQMTISLNITGSNCGNGTTRPVVWKLCRRGATDTNNDGVLVRSLRPVQ